MKNVFLSVSAIGILALAGSAQAQLFNVGNLVINELSQNTGGTLTNAAASQTWREWSPATSAFTGNQLFWNSGNFGTRMTANGSAINEGHITISPGGQYLVGVGYDTARGAANPAAETVAARPRTIGVINTSGISGTINSITDTFSTQNIRAAVTSNGNNFLAVGSGSGVRALDAGAGTTTTAASGGSTITNLRVINQTLVDVAGGIGYGRTVISTSSVGNIGLFVSDPVAGTLTAIPGITGLSGSPNDFIFTSPTTAYIADDSGFSGANSGGIRRFDFNAGTNTWAQTYILRTGLAGLTVGPAANAVSGTRGLAYDWTTGTLYATTSTSTAGGVQGLVAVVDSGPTSNFTLLGTSAIGSTWRSVEFIPSPSAGALLGIGLIASARRRRA